MHGLPCFSLQRCFGAPADVSAEPAGLDSADSRTPTDPNTSLTILTQPGPAGPTEGHPERHRGSQRSGTGRSRSEELAGDDGDVRHVRHEFSQHASQGKSSVPDTEYPHIPRPSIIRSLQVRILNHLDLAVSSLLLILHDVSDVLLLLYFYRFISFNTK